VDRKELEIGRGAWVHRRKAPSSFKTTQLKSRNWGKWREVLSVWDGRKARALRGRETVHTEKFDSSFTDREFVNGRLGDSTQRAGFLRVLVTRGGKHTDKLISDPVGEIDKKE